MPESLKTIHIQYFALLREQSGVEKETVQTSAVTGQELYQELKTKYGFKINEDILRLAINDEFKDWTAPLKQGDSLVFIPPVAGG